MLLIGGVFLVVHKPLCWFFCCRHGSAGLRSDPPRPIVPLRSPHQRAALLRLVMSNQSPRSALPPLLHPFSQPVLRKNPPLDWHEARASAAGAGKDWKGPDAAELLKGPRRFLLKGPSDRDVMICVHDIFLPASLSAIVL